MTMPDVLADSVLNRKAVVYVRQSTPRQVLNNLESQRRQYELVATAHSRGFRDVEVIDEDLGVTANGQMDRPGFERLCAELCGQQVGAVFCFDASRLARNGRDWHQLLELCGVFDARVIDLDGVYNPRLPNDRLLLGMKGSIFEFESGILRARMLGALQDKARRGELRINVPVGYAWYREADGPVFDPDLRIQETIRLVFSRFRDLGSARQVALALRAKEVCFPSPFGGGLAPQWRLISYSNVHTTLKNPFYAGAYAWGKTGQRTVVVDGRLRKSSGHDKPVEQWEVIIRDHHEGYIDWAEYERNLARLAANNYGKSGGSKSGRGGRALLAGLLSCARCGRRLQVVYSGRAPGRAVYLCRQGHVHGLPTCLRFAAKRIDAALAAEAIRVAAPMAIEAALEAERMYGEAQAKQQKIVDLELKQVRYEASLAERRYAACDPDNRLIAAQLEKRWEEALQRVVACETRIRHVPEPTSSMPDFTGLAVDLEAAWNAPTTTMRTRQQLLRTLVTEIIADIDNTAREVVLVIHWRGGQHSQLRVRIPASGAHSVRTSEQAAKVMRSMAGHWSDCDIAASLNRMGMSSAHGYTWNAERVRRYRGDHGLPSRRTVSGKEKLLTLAEAASKLRVNHHVVRRLIRQGVLPAQQAAPKAPWRIRAADLLDETVAAAAARAGNSPCQDQDLPQLPMFSNTSEGDS